jgi:hypothetical protein
MTQSWPRGDLCWYGWVRVERGADEQVFVSGPPLQRPHDSRPGARHPARRARPLASREMTQPQVELLFWEGCPSHPQALEELRAAMTELGLDPDQVLVREVDTDRLADRERFVGSPTIRIDGADVQDPGDEPTALTCRVYHHRDGRVSPVPDPADVRDALRNAMTTRSDQ